MASFIHQNFIPVEAHIKEHPAWFKRFDAVWTPTILVMDSDGHERYRIEGYLPKDEFRARLEMGLARLDAVHKRWESAEKRYAHIVDAYPSSKISYRRRIFVVSICRTKPRFLLERSFSHTGAAAGAGPRLFLTSTSAPMPRSPGFAF